MAKPDHSIGPRILESAKREFQEKGFANASLKTICAHAGITTGALYKRYAGKEELFCALVEPTVRDMRTVMKERSLKDPADTTDEVLIRAWEMGTEEMMWWFDFLYERREGFVLLLTAAAGTRYANFQHDWVEAMTGETEAWYQEARRRGIFRRDLSRKELHIILTAFWSTVYEPFIHGMSYEEIRKHCEVCCGLFNWYGALLLNAPE